MKIALIHSHLNGRGGSQRYVLEIAREMQKQGVDINIYAFQYDKKSCYPELVGDLSIQCVELVNGSRVPLVNNKLDVRGRLKNIIKKLLIESSVSNSLGMDYLMSMWGTKKTSRKLAQLLDSTKGYDLIFAHEEPLSIWAAIEYKKMSGIPIYWFCYDTIEKWYLEWKDEHKASILRSLILKGIMFKYDKKIIRKYVDRIAVLDNKMVDKVCNLYGVTPLVRRGGVPKDILNYDRCNYIREKYAVDCSRVVVFSLTRFINYRRVHDLFELYEKLPEDIREKLFFYINAPITDGRYYDVCEKKYKKIFQNSNYIIDTSYPNNDEEMYKMFRSSDIFIFPNQDQTWGHAPLEAMASGCLALVSNGCGIHEVISGITSTVFDVGDIDSLIKVFTKVLQNEDYIELARIQKSYVSNNLTWEKVCELYVKDFHDIVYTS